MSGRTMMYVRVLDGVRQRDGRSTCEPDMSVFLCARKGASFVRYVRASDRWSLHSLRGRSHGFH